jgi:hypothetical protein
LIVLPSVQAVLFVVGIACGVSIAHRLVGAKRKPTRGPSDVGSCTTPSAPEAKPAKGVTTVALEHDESTVAAVAELHSKSAVDVCASGERGARAIEEAMATRSVQPQPVGDARAESHYRQDVYAAQYATLEAIESEEGLALDYDDADHWPAGHISRDT